MCSVAKLPTSSTPKFQGISSSSLSSACSLSWISPTDIAELTAAAVTAVYFIGGYVISRVRSAMKSLLGRALSPTMYLSLAILQIMQYCCNADAGNIDISPVTQHANLSSSDYASFYCRATGSNTLWSIQGMNYNSGNHTQDGYRFSEVIVQEHENGNIVHDMYLEIRTSLENNETTIQCIAFVDTPSFSDTVKLIVQGGPAAPVVVLRPVNSTLIILQWDKPFTWPYTQIQHYTVSSNNSMPNWNGPDTSLKIKASEPARECAAYSFTVTANNGLADGQPTTVTGGFPIAPRMPEDPITAHVTFTSDRSPIIQLTIKLPEVCDYQRVTYWVTLRNPNSEVIFEEHHDQLYGEAPTVQLDSIRPDSDQQYFIVTFDLEGFGENLTASKTISATLNPPTPEQGSGLDTELVVLIAAVGGATLLIVLIIIVVAVAVCCYKKKKSAVFRTGSPQKSPMVTNPIYEGQSVYETIDPHFRPISYTSSLPPTGTRPIMESPYAHSQVDPAYAYPSPHPGTTSMEDGYTVMASAGGLGKEIPDSSGESNLDSEVARYVPDPSMLISEC